MITITRETDPQKNTEICDAEGIPATSDVVIFTAKDREDVLGYSLFSVSDKLHMININTEPVLWNSIGDGLFRATLNFAVEHGIHSATIREDLLKKLAGNVIPEDAAATDIDDCEGFLQSIKRCAG